MNKLMGFIRQKSFRLFSAIQTLKITVLAVAFFMSFSCLENVLERYELKPIAVLSKYSYELFLGQLCIMAVFTVIIKWFSDKIIGFASRLST